MTRRAGPWRHFCMGSPATWCSGESTRRPWAEMEITEECAGPEDLLEDLTRSESIEQVRQAVLSLPPVFREVIVLCDLQDSSYDEAAAALDCPVGTVRSRLSRGRAMLARKLRG
jgi:RNA polymerase sigma-70 factor, ECF subfamily